MSAIEVGEREEQVVVFRLADETYGVDISQVQEIIRLQAITQVPGTPRFVEGVINLRGRIIPVIDLSRRFGLRNASPSKEQRIVVVETAVQSVGMVVDAVSEVLAFPSDRVERPSSIVTDVDADYIRGIANLNDKLVILLLLDKVIAAEPHEQVVLEDLT